MCARFVCFSWPFKGYVAYKEDVIKNDLSLLVLSGYALVLFVFVGLCCL